MIPGFSDVTRLPRLGKIRLGEKRMSQGGKEYPAALDHMNLEEVPWVAEALGCALCHDDKSGKPTCKELDIIFPIDDERVIFPQARKAYRASGLFCICDDGVTATRVRAEGGKDAQGEAFIAEQGLEVEVGEMFKLPCPGDDCPYHEAKHCKPVGRLLFMIPNVPRLGVYEITTSSWNTMVNVNSYLAFVRSIAGKIDLVPFKLRLRPQEVQPDGKKKTVYVLELAYEGNVFDLMKLRTRPDRALPAPLVVPSSIELDREVPDDLFPAAAAAAPVPAAPRPDVAAEARAKLGKKPAPKAAPVQATAPATAPPAETEAEEFVDQVSPEEPPHPATTPAQAVKPIGGTRGLW